MDGSRAGAPLIVQFASYSKSHTRDRIATRRAPVEAASEAGWTPM